MHTSMVLTQLTTMEFPGLGIGRFSIDRVAFSLFGKGVYWYGVIIMCGILVAVLYAWYRSRQEGISSNDLMDLALATVVTGIVGARAYYVLTSPDRFESIVDAFAIWNGGLAIYGGIIGGALAIVVTCCIKKINTFRVLDMVAPGVMIAQAIGRWGNFCNGEAFGYEVTEGSFLYTFRMGLVSSYTHTGDVMHYYHPTFLYESLWNVAGFVLITLLYRKKKFQGQIALSYLIWYGFGRMFIEGLRTDSLYVGPFRISQVVGFLCFSLGAIAWIIGYILQRKGKLPAAFAVTWVTGEEMQTEPEMIREVSQEDVQEVQNENNETNQVEDHTNGDE